ncbi:MAG: prolipoprotein diacylglyceryl transferase [bacterium]|nr:prolipoprotein diacylglyceryl transferase [bacterium]
MFFYFLFLLLGLLAFLFTTYVLAKDDMLFVRKNVSLDELFTLTFLSVGVGLFFSRIFFVIFNFKAVYLNPLVFLLVFYYPGLSFPGGLLAGSAFVLLYARGKKMPLSHVVDFLGLGLLCAVPFGYIATLFLERFSPFQHLFLPILIWLLFGLAVGLLLPRVLSRELKSGTLGASSILVVSFINFLTSILDSINAGVFSVSSADIISLVTFLFSLVFFIKQEYILAKVKK